MKTIVLITRENNERATHAAVYLCDNYSEARQFCRFVNRLTLEGGEKLAARVAVMNKEYSLGKYVPCLTAERFYEAAAAYQKVREEKATEPDDEDDLDLVGSVADVNNVVLVFRGSGGITHTVSVSLLSSYEYADNFCNYLNDLKLDKNSFIHAIHAKEMVEYETTKPMLTRFDEIFKYCEFVDEHRGTEIVRYTLGKFSPNTLVQAFMGLDKCSRESFLQLLPLKTADKINEIIKASDNRSAYLPTLSQIRKAREKIINAVSKNAQKFLDDVLTGHKGEAEMLKDRYE